MDNRKCNLRIVTSHKNSRNMKNNIKIGIGLWGTSYHKQTKKWSSYVSLKGKKIYPKPTLYSTEQEAHKVAIKLYKKLTGRFPKIK